MRIAVTTAVAACSFLAGCDRPAPDPFEGTIHITLDPHNRKWSTISKGNSPTYKLSPEATFSSRNGQGAPGEWSSSLVLAAAAESLANPYIVIRLFDAEQGAVRVEATFTGTPIKGLQHLTFPHVTRSEKFSLKDGTGDAKPYQGVFQKGENLELRLPTGDGTVTFLAWPHVH